MTDEALEYVDRLVKAKLSSLGDDELYCIHANTKELRERFPNVSRRHRSMLISHYFKLHPEHLVDVTTSHGYRYYIARHVP